MTYVTTWTADQVAQLRTLWSDHLSASQIAEAMGLTRNAVIGKAHRLGLDERPSPIIRPVAPRVPVPALATGTCRFIAADPKVDPTPCGAPVSAWDSPYCPTHRARCYQSGTSLETTRVSAASHAAAANRTFGMVK